MTHFWCRVSSASVSIPFQHCSTLFQYRFFAATSLFSVDIYVYSQFGNNYKWSKFSRSMLDRLPVSSKMGIYLQNTTGVHYDVVLDVSEGISNLNTSENQKINFSSKKEVGQNMIILSAHLFAKGLKPLDVGSDGNCFFRAVSHHFKIPTFIKLCAQQL